ncbi:uncharacterized protein LOC133205715 [Saccostrea echinata]|uniref:uncharacterized protein LOC133205715 n=1 Tax=Saccostrea echinata TaxID=191078 RepID=UPI002A83EE82|nr:uncharacterized protein LOC133205715 [Saccostrea echinata]
MDDASFNSAQHFVLCTICDGNAEFHCNSCHDDLCQICKKGHLRSNATKLHEIVSYTKKGEEKDPPEEVYESKDVKKETTSLTKTSPANSDSNTIDSASVHENETISDEKKDLSRSLFSGVRQNATDVSLAQCVIQNEITNTSATCNTETNEEGTFSPQCVVGATAISEVIENSPAVDNPDLTSAQWPILDKSDESSDLVPSLTWEATVRLPNHTSKSGCHISCAGSNTMWISDMSGSLILLDFQGNVLENIQTRSGAGFHTLAQDGLLLYTDMENKRILKVHYEQKISGAFKTSLRLKPFKKTGDWTPLCICSSRYTGDLLVGMVKEHRARIMRYDSMGKEKQGIEFDSKNDALYGLPQFVTENANMDVITSDRTELVAVDITGGRRWIYSGAGKTGSGFLPAGICCDMLLNIVVFDVFSNNVHLVDKDGNFLSRLLVLGNSWIPQGLCFDEENRLYCGDRSKILIYTYEHV